MVVMVPLVSHPVVCVVVENVDELTRQNESYWIEGSKEGRSPCLLAAETVDLGLVVAFSGAAVTHGLRHLRCQLQEHGMAGPYG